LGVIEEEEDLLYFLITMLKKGNRFHLNKNYGNYRLENLIFIWYIGVIMAKTREISLKLAKKGRKSANAK